MENLYEIAHWSNSFKAWAKLSKVHVDIVALVSDGHAEDPGSDREQDADGPRLAQGSHGPAGKNQALTSKFGWNWSFQYSTKNESIWTQENMLDCSN